MPREARIRLGSEIRELLRRGERKKTRHVDVFFSASPVSHARLGLIVPKFGHRIVQRNLLKRRLREIGRRSVLPRLAERECHVDVLFRARRSAYDIDFAGLEGCVLGAMEGLCSERS
ncbi:MAG: ribonuclease P protein component [Gemmatimonadota bacterium]